jgi:hypothetical protein
MRGGMERKVGIQGWRAPCAAWGLASPCRALANLVHLQYLLAFGNLCRGSLKYPRSNLLVEIHVIPRNNLYFDLGIVLKQSSIMRCMHCGNGHACL